MYLNNMSNKSIDKFAKVYSDFLSDISSTFPEFAEKIAFIKLAPPENNFNHCLQVFPERFLDILYQNAEIFAAESEVRVDFIPEVDFKYVWASDISDNTRGIIWKYLQLILFSIIGDVNSQENLGESANLFEAISGDEFRDKLAETVEQLQREFGDNQTTVPDAEGLHDHLKGLLKGKLGKIAQEIAEETATELNLSPEDLETGNVNDVFKKLFKNPTKLMNMVKTIGTKMDAKMKSGEIKESEIMEEVSEMMSTMKNMPGAQNIEAMMRSMGLGGGGGGKMNMGAMQAHLQRNMNMAKTRERMTAKLNKNKTDPVASTTEHPVKSNGYTDEELEFISFRPDGAEKAEKSKKKKNKK